MSKKKKKERQEPESLALPAYGVDTHAHLDMGPGKDRPDLAIKRAKACGVNHIGQVFLSPEAYHRQEVFFRDYPEVFFLLGIHPHDADRWSEDMAKEMKKAFLQDMRLRAVGEIGLDFHYNYSPQAVQKEVFTTQLQLAKTLEKPVVIHCREAFSETLEILDREGFKQYPLLWHCFGGSRDMAGAIIERGWMISVPGIITWSKMDDLRRAVAEVPLKQLVLETDSPFLTPEPWRGKTNEPAFLGFTAQAVARARGVDIKEVWQATAHNALKFFQLL